MSSPRKECENEFTVLEESLEEKHGASSVFNHLANMDEETASAIFGDKTVGSALAEIDNPEAHSELTFSAGTEIHSGNGIPPEQDLELFLDLEPFQFGDYYQSDGFSTETTPLPNTETNDRNGIFEPVPSDGNATEITSPNEFTETMPQPNTISKDSQTSTRLSADKLLLEDIRCAFTKAKRITDARKMLEKQYKGIISKDTLNTRLGELFTLQGVFKSPFVYLSEMKDNKPLGNLGTMTLGDALAEVKNAKAQKGLSLTPTKLAPLAPPDFHKALHRFYVQHNLLPPSQPIDVTERPKKRGRFV